MDKLLMTDVYGNMAGLSFTGFLLSVLTAFILGAALANLYYATSTTATKGFAMTLAIFPPVTCVVLLLISKNFGAGLAVAGIFALVKFKSIAGNAKEIVALFISTGIGILCGTGFLMLSIPFSIIILLVFYAYSNMNIWNTKKEYRNVRMLKINASKKEGAREELENFLDQYVVDKTLVAVENKISKEKTEKLKPDKVKSDSDKTDKKKIEKDKTEKNKEGTANKILNYTYTITFADESSINNLIEALVRADYGFEFGQLADKKQMKL